MKYDSDIHHRRSLRLRRYDYSRAGAYFVTLCVQDRKYLFGGVLNDEMRSNIAGEMIQSIWNEIPDYYSGVEIDEFVMMPNHVHGIIFLSGTGSRTCPNSLQSRISGTVGATPRGCPNSSQSQNIGQAQGPAPTGGQPRAGMRPLSLPDVVHRFKTMTTKRYADGVKQNGWAPFPGRLWQRNYWERVIRNELELDLIREYIRNNPAQWAMDKLNIQGTQYTVNRNLPEILDWMV